MVSSIKNGLNILLYCLGYLAAMYSLFPAAASADQIILAWDANTEPDLAGYVVYGKQGSPCPPYDYIDTYPEEDLDDPLFPTIVITGLDNNIVYYFVVTAYNTAEMESDFSNIVSSTGEDAVCFRENSSGGGSGGGGGGGGGGCFIATAASRLRKEEDNLGDADLPVE